MALEKCFTYLTFFGCTKKWNGIFVDELDSKLYPLLTRYIINLFHKSDTNKGNV